MNTSKDNQMSRRDFMKAAIAAISGVIGAAIGLPAVTYIMGPALKKEEADWIRLGTIAKVELGNPTLFKTTIESQTGWITAQEEVAAYVLTEDGQNFIAMSNICTHLACRVRWIQDEGKFFCPCHVGIYAKDGSVISGPPPRPLDRFATKIEDGELYIQRGKDA